MMRRRLHYVRPHGALGCVNKMLEYNKYHGITKSIYSAIRDSEK